MARHRWRFDHQLVEGGLILQKVSHEGFSIAKDIRVTRIWIDTEYPDVSTGAHPQDYVLNGSSLPSHTPVVDADPAAAANPSPFFSGYNVLFSVGTEYKSARPYLEGTPNACDIRMKQHYLFTDYGKNPVHEPGGVLDACRLFPLLGFEFPAVSDQSLPYPKYFRADYRLDIDLDNIDEATVSSGLVVPGDIVTNKAAIFRDKETIPGPVGQVGQVARLVGSVATGGLGVQEIFAALEKPLAFEIASWGLVGGHAVAGVATRDCWDNVHVWPAVRGAGTDAVSTPGAFHAFHCHWRWGAVAGDATQAGSLLPNAGEPQFRGVGWSSTEGGALVDGSIPQQNVRFAITRNDNPQRWAKEKNPSTESFPDLFTSERALPDVVDSGDDLVLWLSFEVFRPDSLVTQPWSGTLFVNGFYFAHNKDQTPWRLVVGGAHGEAQRPAPTQKWERLAR